VLETFVNGLMIDIAYQVVTKVGGWARNWVHLPLITFSMLLVSVSCVYVRHYTTSCISSRTGRTSISTSNHQHVRSVRRLVAYSTDVLKYRNNVVLLVAVRRSPDQC